MQFNQDPSTRCWEADTELRGHKVRISIDPVHPASEHNRLGDVALKRVDAAWDRIRENIVRSLHSTYNDCWADPDQGFHPLEANEFLDRLTLDSIDVGDEGGLTIYFLDGDLFGGHYIEVFWSSEEEMFDATLIG